MTLPKVGKHSQSFPFTAQLTALSTFWKGFSKHTMISDRNLFEGLGTDAF